MRIPIWIACVTALAAAQDPREIVRRSLDRDQKNAEIARNYTYLQRQRQRDLDGSGKVKKTDVRTWDVTFLEGSPYRRLVARDDKPLSPKEQAQEEEKLKKSLTQRRKETAEQKQRRIAEWQRKQQKQRESLTEMLDAFDFRLVGEESLNGGDAYVVDATPRRGYKPKLPSASYFMKIKARLWIDQKEHQWIKVDAETLDTITFGGILARIAKGGRVAMEQTRINDEVWMPKRIALQASARVLLVKGYHAELEVTYSDYKKFSAESRVVPAEQE